MFKTIPTDILVFSFFVCTSSVLEDKKIKTPEIKISYINTVGCVDLEQATPAARPGYEHFVDS